MQGSNGEGARHEVSRDGDGGPHGDDDPVKLTLPPALIGFLLLLAVTLACVFYVAAQVVQTP